MKQPTMVYKALDAGEHDANEVERDGARYTYQILDLDDDDPAPDGWTRTIGEKAAEPAPVKKQKTKPVKDADGDSDGN